MLSVRAATPADAAAVAGVHVRSWQVGYRGLLPDSYLDSLRPEDRAGGYRFGRLGPDHPATVVALENTAICGFATTGPSRSEDTPRAGELLALYVDPDRWSRGAGRLLIVTARRALSDRGFAEAILWVLAGNERAERFYRTDGWTQDGSRRTEVLWGVAADEVRYRRRLP